VPVRHLKVGVQELLLKATCDVKENFQLCHRLYLLIFLIADHLNSGAHLETVSEDLQMMWFQVEPELTTVITEGLVPPCDIDSAGQSKSPI